jgi:uncharacterized SAM-binding protein YcdF (DUF218 family)
LALPTGLIEQDTRGEGGVEGFDVAGGDADGLGVGLMIGRDAAAFVADEDGGGEVERGRGDRLRGAWVSGEEGDGVALDGGEELLPITGGEGDAEQGTGGGAEGFGVPWAGRTFEEDDACGAEGFGGADDGAGVAGVLEAVEGEEERGAVEEVVEGPGIDAHEGEHALGCLDGRDLVEGGVVDEVEVRPAVKLAGGGGSGEDGGDVGAGAIRFAQKMEALGDSVAVLGTSAALDGFADALYERVVDAEHSYRLLSIARRKDRVGLVGGLAWLSGIAVLVWLGVLTVRIHRQSTVDEARAADVIVVMGAAEYRGKPSPVLKARLDHGFSLWQRRLAPHIITTGGAGGDPVFTEGTVGRNYLITRGVPGEAIILEDEGATTVHSTVAVAEIMSRMGLRSCILVSDGYHIYRAKKLLEARGVRVYGSPRAIKAATGWRDWWLYARQAAGYSLWRLGVPI